MFIQLVMQGVVLKHIPMASASDCLNFRSSKTTSAAAFPVPEFIFVIPMSFVLSSFNEVIRTESWSILGPTPPLTLGRCFPSQYTIDLILLLLLLFCIFYVPDKFFFCDNELFESKTAHIEHGATSLTTEASIIVKFCMLAFVGICKIYTVNQNILNMECKL